MLRRIEEARGKAAPDEVPARAGGDGARGRAAAPAPSNVFEPDGGGEKT
jgi:hypothetical protein